MNEISSYDPEMYHATLTHSVFVRLEGSVIRLSKPNHNIARRATHNEAKPDVTYISQKIYDLSNSKVCRSFGWTLPRTLLSDLSSITPLLGLLTAPEPGQEARLEQEIPHLHRPGQTRRLHVQSRGRQDGGRGRRQRQRRGAQLLLLRQGAHPLPVWEDGQREGRVVPALPGSIQVEGRAEESLGARRDQSW